MNGNQPATGSAMPRGFSGVVPHGLDLLGQALRVTTAPVTVESSTVTRQDIRTPGYELVRFIHDADSGLKGFIAIHNTSRGPAIGGCRIWNYPDVDAAHHDVLKLSRGMTHKNALAKLPHGGGKVALILPEGPFDRAKLYEALGREVDLLGGKYYTAEDVGTSPEDIEVARRNTRYVVGKQASIGGIGNPAVYTAQGVFVAMRQAALIQFGSEELTGKVVSIQGVGAVGGRLAEHCLAAGATVALSDTNETRIEEVVSLLSKKYPGRIIQTQPDYSLVLPMADIISPCALGGVFDEAIVRRMRAGVVVAGAANNQLASLEIGELLAEKGILYVPDFVANAGGVIAASAELIPGSEAEREKTIVGRVNAIGATFQEIVNLGVNNLQAAAERVAESRIS